MKFQSHRKVCNSAQCLQNRAISEEIDCVLRLVTLNHTPTLHQMKKLDVVSLKEKTNF